jgi:hypothetical protein
LIIFSENPLHYWEENMAKLILADGTTITLEEEVELPIEIPTSVELTLTFESGLTITATLPDVAAIIY